MIDNAQPLVAVDLVNIEDKPLVVVTDASDYALGAVLLQKQNNEDYAPVEFLSRGWTEAESIHAPTTKEFGCSVEEVKH